MRNRAQVLEDLLECLAGSARTPRDWQAVVELAGETLTIGTLSETVLPEPGAFVVPAEIRDLLIAVRDRARERNERLTAQLSEMLPSLNAVGVEPVVMRGMARLISGTHARSRLVSDIDLLIPAPKLHECMQALAALEYEVFKGFEFDLGPFELCRSRDVGMIDLHTQVPPMYLQLGYERIAKLCKRTPVGPGHALVPSPTCQLMLTIVHDELHDGDYWRGLVDLRHLIDARELVAEGIDWDELAGFFPCGSPVRALQVHLRTVRSLVEVVVPERLCGGSWARLQVLRRKLQTHIESLRPALTLLTIALDPPPSSKPGMSFRNRVADAGWSKPRRFIHHYLRPIPSGKFPVG